MNNKQNGIIDARVQRKENPEIEGTITGCIENNGKESILVKFEDGKNEAIYLDEFSKKFKYPDNEVLRFYYEESEKQLKNKKVEVLLKKQYETDYKFFRDYVITNKKTEQRPLPEIDWSKTKETVLSLAEEGMPEAIYVVCTNNKVYMKKLSAVMRYDQSVLNLFNNHGGIRYLIDKQQNMKNKKKSGENLEEQFEDVIEKWERRRNRIFNGNKDAYDEESIVFIKENIIPIATEDIWNSLYEFFNRPDTLLPQKDIEEFNRIYSEKKNPELEITGVQEKKQPVCFGKTIKWAIDTCKGKKIEDEDFYAYIAKKPLDEVKLYLAYDYMVKSLKNEGEGELLNTAITVLKSAGSELLIKLIDGLYYDSYVELIETLFLQLNNKIPENWKKVLRFEFEKTIDKEANGWWISLIEKTGILKEYTEKIEFWEGLKNSYIPIVIARLQNCAPDSFEQFTIELLRNLPENKLSIKEWWYEALISRIGTSENSVSELTRFFHSACNSESDEKQFIKGLLRAKRLNEKKSVSDKASDRKSGDEVEQLVSSLRKIESLEELSARAIIVNKSNIGFAQEVIKLITDLRSDIKYMAKHVWNVEINGVLDPDDYRCLSELDFDPELHTSETALDPGTKVKGLSLGFKIDNLVFIKAKVVEV